VQVFPTTQWTALAMASLNGETVAREALVTFYQRYRAPVQQVLRLRGCPQADLDDVTHDFFLHLMGSASLRRADRTRGRFRSYLLGTLMHYLADVHDRRMAQKRGGGALHVSLDEPGSDVEPRSPQPAVPPALVLEFDRAWALAVLHDAMAALSAEHEAAGTQGSFELLKSFLPGATARISYEDAAARTGRPLATVKSDILRMRRRLRELVRGRIAETLSAPHELEDEMAYLQEVLLDRGSALAESRGD
jgi:DNA-directed RNA polymerase specialized sigma24 family protein